jgi:uncharacterized membrane-anchored protein YhcB (DUF1043 family)
MTCALIFLFLVIGLKFGFDFLNRTEEIKIEKYDVEIEKAKASFPVENQKAVLTFKNSVNSLKTILDNKVKTSEFLTTIANNTHKEIYFTQLNMNIKENTISINGVAKNLSVVSQAATAFSQISGVEGVEITNSRETYSIITFNLILNVNNSFFK